MSKFMWIIPIASVPLPLDALVPSTISLSQYVSTSSLIAWNIRAFQCHPNKHQFFQLAYLSSYISISYPGLALALFLYRSTLSASLSLPLFSQLPRSFQICVAMALPRAMLVLAVSFALVALSIAQSPSSAPTGSATPPTTTKRAPPSVSTPPPSTATPPTPSKTAPPPATATSPASSPPTISGAPPPSAGSPSPSANSSPPSPPAVPASSPSSSSGTSPAPTPQAPGSSPSIAETPGQAPVASNPNSNAFVLGSSLATVALLGGAALVLLA